MILDKCAKNGGIETTHRQPTVISFLWQEFIEMQRLVSCHVFSKLAEDAIEVGGECSGRLGHEEDDRVTLGEGVGIIAVLRCHPSVAADTVQLLLRVRVTPLGVAENDDVEVLLSVAKRDEVPIGTGGGASAASRAVALCAGGEERSVALELPARGRGAKADQVWDVSLVDMGVVALTLSLGGGGPVSLG